MRASTPRQPSKGSPVRRLLKELFFLLEGFWTYGRWFALKGISLLIFAARGKSRDAQMQVIRLGNAFFRPAFSHKIFRDYDSYVQLYPPTLGPYLDLAPGEQWLDGKVILDLGAGLGQYSCLLARSGAKRVVPLEYQHAKTVWCRDHLRADSQVEGFWPVTGSAETLPFREAAFDAIFSHTVFEHIADGRNALLSAASVLKPGGLLVMSFNFFHHRGGHHLFPYVHFPWATWLADEEALCEYWSERLARDQAAGLMKFFPAGCRIRSLSEGNEFHLNKMKFEEFESAVREAGLKVVRRIPSEALARNFPFLLRLPRLKYFLAGTVYYALRREA